MFWGPGLKNTHPARNLGSTATSQKPGMGTGDAEAGRSGLQGLPQLHHALRASLGYMRPCLKDRKFSVLLHIPDTPASLCRLPADTSLPAGPAFV